MSRYNARWALAVVAYVSFVYENDNDRWAMTVDRYTIYNDRWAMIVAKWSTFGVGDRRSAGAGA